MIVVSQRLMDDLVAACNLISVEFVGLVVCIVAIALLFSFFRR